MLSFSKISQYKSTMSAMSLHKLSPKMHHLCIISQISSLLS